MKNFNFLTMPQFTLFTLLLFFLGFPLSAQQIITEHISKNIKGKVQYKPIFNKNDYKKNTDKNGANIFIKNQNPDQNIQETIYTKAKVPLTVNFNYDESEYYISSFLIFSESGYSYAADYSTLLDPLILNIPVGIYEVITTFSPINSGQSHVVIKEQQSIQADKSITVNPIEAVNHFSTTAYNENGELFPSDVLGNFFFRRFLYYNPTNSVATIDGYFTSPVVGQEPEWNFYINTVSDRYSFIQTLNASNFPKGTYSAKFKTITGISSAVSIANNPAEWSYHSQKFQSTKGSNDLAPAHLSASTYKGKLLGGWLASAGGTIDPGNDPYQGYVSNRLDGDLADLIVIPAIIDAYISYSSTTGGVTYFTKGNPIYSDGNGKILYGSGDVSFNSHADPQYAVIPYLSDDYYVEADHETKLFPIHPKFNFDKMTNPAVILGDNVPITVTGFENNQLKIANKGRYGETRETDYLTIHLEIKKDGNSIYSGLLEDYSINLPTSGQIELTLTNPNTIVEGLEGKNTTTISYNGSDAPPTLQHLQFRNAANKVTDIFDSTEGANLRIAAGDFKYVNGGTKGYFNYVPGNTVEVSYTKHSQIQWLPLAITKHPEYFQMPAFGNYYEVSLGTVMNNNSDNWYDVKVVCTDADGNKQEQIISPAFKVNGTLAVTENTTSDFAVYPNPFSQILNIKLPSKITGNYVLKITDLSGKTVYSKTQREQQLKWDGSAIPKGVYFLSIENNGEVLTKKVIKK